METVLIIDDEKLVRDSYEKILKAYNYHPVLAKNSSEAYEFIKQVKPSAIILDLVLGPENGIDILTEIKKIDFDLPVIIATGFGNIPTAVEAIKLGAYDFFMKPPDFEKMMISIKRAIENRELKNKIKNLDTALSNSYEMVLGKSDIAKEMIRQILQVSQTDFSIILQGETGTGKTFIASIIHNLSHRANKPFIKVDIGAIPENLVESELFGHEKGSFTGADKKKKGFFEIANKGTVFIDELENMSPFVQAKLLTSVEEKKFYPVGSTEYVNSDIRIIAASNIDIKKSVKEKKFREDLLYRLGEFIINIPSLKERPVDIQYFAQKFVHDANNDLKKNIKGISNTALQKLLSYNWPGNIRELKTVIKKAVLFAEDTINENDIVFINSLTDEGYNEDQNSFLIFKDSVENAEKKCIQKALKLCNGNKTKASQLIDLNYKTLLRKMKEYDI